MIGAVHEQHRCIVGQERPDLIHVGPEPTDEGLGIVGHGRTVPVSGNEVLGPDPRPVGRLPDERRGVDGRRDPSPHHCMVQPGQRKNLWHLGDVSEHVGEVAHIHHPSEGGAPSDAGLQVADDGFARDEELVHQDVPRTQGEPSGGCQRVQALLVLGADLEIVVDDRQLAIEEEGLVGGIPFQKVNQAIDQMNQLQPERLERVIPLPVPVGVGDDGDASGRRWPPPSFRG